MYRKAWDIVGWTADADVWCNDCARSAYGEDSPTRFDGEGNLVHPIFVSELGQWLCDCCGEGDAPHCNKCGESVFA